MPLIFMFMLARFPAGLVIYWSTNNLLTMAQQWLIMRRTHLSRPGMARVDRPAAKGKSAPRVGDDPKPKVLAAGAGAAEEE
jgi:membrane protein insertase Oxa1/YidC/SpoIIIJ